MAEVFARVGNKKLTKIIASTREVQYALDREATDGALRARARLDAAASHNPDIARRAYISTGRGRIDRFVILNDERGQAAAMSIEFGRNDVKDSPNDPGPSRGVWALHDAFDLPHRE